MAKPVLEKFRQELTVRMERAGMRQADLMRASGVSKQNLSRILNNTPHSVTGALPTITRPTVEKIAKALHWHLPFALEAAGYASYDEDDGKAKDARSTISKRLIEMAHTFDRMPNKRLSQKEMQAEPLIDALDRLIRKGE